MVGIDLEGRKECLGIWIGQSEDEGAPMLVVPGADILTKSRGTSPQDYLLTTCSYLSKKLISPQESHCNS